MNLLESIERHIFAYVCLFVTLMILIITLYGLFAPDTFTGYYLDGTGDYNRALCIRMQIDNRIDTIYYSNSNEEKVMSEWNKIVERGETIVDYDRKKTE